MIVALIVFLIGGWTTAWSHFAMLQHVNLLSTQTDSIPELRNSGWQVWQRYKTLAPKGKWSVVMATGITAQLIGFVGLILTFSAQPVSGGGR